MRIAWPKFLLITTAALWAVIFALFVCQEIFGAHAQEAIPRYLSGPIEVGTKPTNTGSCGITTQLGGMAAGSFVGSASCATVAGGLVLNFKNLPGTGWTCTLHDLTTPADAINQTAYVTTYSTGTATATFTATWAASDLITYQCDAF